jgi:DNA invertase Pin-like site-specific DNA recombinase
MTPTERRLANLQAGRDRHSYIDDIAVERLVNGWPPANTTAAERREAVRILRRRHVPVAEIAERMGVTERSVTRYIADLKAAA